MEKLTVDQKAALARSIETLDPKGEIVRLSPGTGSTAGSIAYRTDTGVGLGERVTRLTDEEYVRAWLVVRLVKVFKYPADCLDIEHTYTIGRPSPTKAQIDIRVHDKRGKKPQTFMIIEVKRPDDYESYSKLIDDQLFATGRDESTRGLRYAIWHTVEFRGSEPYDRCIIIDFRAFTEHRAWVEAGEPGHNLDLPREYGVVRKTKFVKGGENDLRVDLTREDFTRLQKDFHNRLWGGAKMGDTDVFKNLLKMFIAKIHDENGTESGGAYRFQTELKDGRPETADEILTKVDNLYREALAHYFGYDDETASHERINKEQFSPNKVAYVMERLESISVTDNKFEDDVLGAFFEGIVRTGFKQEKGQFFTHANIVRFILLALDLDLDIVTRLNSNSPTIPHIIDPSCGSGTFLIEAMKLITASVVHPRPGSRSISTSRRTKDFVQEWFQPTAQNHNIQNRWARQFVYGVEANADLALATKVNMIVHGDGNANIFKNDGLAAFDKYEPTKDNINSRLKDEDGASRRTNLPYKRACNEQFDVVIGNPPFSLKDDPRTLSEYAGRFLYADKKNSENLFIERWYQLLKPDGKLGVVLPDSVFDTNENLYIRLFLYRFFFIKAVVSLPPVAFQPYTPTKTSLLFAVKKKTADIEAWDLAWRDASVAYSKLRRSPVIAATLTNDRIRDRLIEMVNRCEVEWYPPTNILTTTTLPADIRLQLTQAGSKSSATQKKVLELLEQLDGFVKAGSFKKIATVQEKEARDICAGLLRDKLSPVIAKLPLLELIESAYDDLVEAADLNYTEDPSGQNYCNAWWCFAEVTSHEALSYPIFFAEAGQVGYKRTTRHPEGIEQPNDLFRTDSEGGILIDTDQPQSILDHLRSQRLFFLNPENFHDAEGITSYHADLGRCSASFSLRMSARYLHPRFRFLSEHVLNAVPTTTLGKLVSRSIDTGVQPEYADDGISVVKIGTMQRGHFDWSDAQFVDEEFYAKYKRRAGIKRGDILISSTGVGSLGKVDLWESDAPAIATVDVNIVRIDQSRAYPVMITHLLRHRVAQWQIERELAGSTNQIHVYGHQLARLRLPVFSARSTSGLLARMSRLEEEITTARAALRAEDDVIDEILCEAFGYPLAEHRERARVRQYRSSLASMADGFTLRGSVRFHHPDFELTQEFFDHTPHERVKAFVAVPTRLGATATKADLLREGDAYYVHPGATKRQRNIELDHCHQITREFYASNQRRFGLRAGDVIINRSGEALGKVSLYEHEDEDAIASDFTMRLRFNNRLDPTFAWLYFRSVIFQTQIQRELRGSSLPNIFPPQVERMLVVSCSRTQQVEVAARVMRSLEKGDLHHATIREKRKEIERLIDVAIEHETT